MVSLPAPGAGVPQLGTGDAVAALILLEGDRYLLQCRDDDPRIWYPGHWGCFGGAVDEGEGPVAALWRELGEELELRPRQATYFTRFDYDLGEFGRGWCYRMYYVVPLTGEEEAGLVLHEGRSMAAFDGETIFRELRVTPYDAFALFLHHARARIGRGSATDGT